MKPTMKRLTVFLALAVGPFAAFTLGCHTTEPTSPASRGLDQPVHPPKAPDLGHSASRNETDVHYRMFIEEGVRSMCSGPSPTFTFDSTKATGQNDPTMQNLATCMIEGPLKGKTIRLVNRGARLIALSEADFAPKDALAVSLGAQTLAPGTATTALVVTTNPGAQPRARPKVRPPRTP